MPNAFTLMGILPGAIRSYEEKAKINKEEADKAFKFHKKILGEYLTNCTSQEQSWLVLYNGTYNPE